MPGLCVRCAGFIDEPGGKHLIMRHDNGRWTAIPGSRSLNVYTLRAIIKQCGLTEAQYLKLYHGKR